MPGAPYPFESIKGSDALNLGFEVQHWRSLAARQVPFANSEQELFFFRLAATSIGPILSGFAHWILERAGSAGLRHVLCCTREGYLFAKFLAALQANMRVGCRSGPLAISVLPTSRQASFLPTLTAQNWKIKLAEALDRRHVTVSQLLSSVGLDVPRHLQRSARAIQKSESLTAPVRSDQELEQLLAWVESCLERLLENAEASRCALRGLVNQKTQGEPYAVCDFGGAGTIPRQLAEVLDPKADISLVFYLHAGQSTVLGSSRPQSFLPQGQVTERIRRTPEVLESLLVGRSASVSGYTRNQEGWQIAYAQSATAQGEQHPNHKPLQAFERGLDAWLDVSATTQLTHPGFTAAESARWLLRLMDNPHPLEIRHLGGLIHEENYGSQTREPVVNASDQAIIEGNGGAEEVATLFSRDPFTESLRPIRWPQAAILHHAPDTTPYWKLAQGRAGRTRPACIDALSALGLEKVSVFGAGQAFKQIKPFLDEYGICVEHLIDRKAALHSLQVEGIPATTLAAAIQAGACAFLIASKAFIEDMVADIQRLAGTEGPPVRIVLLDGEIRTARAAGSSGEAVRPPRTGGTQTTAGTPKTA